MSGANSRPSVAVQIAGHEYKIRSDGDEDGLVRIAGYVDRAMERVRERTGTVDSLDVAVLTCLNLAREILAIHGQRSSVMDDEKLRSLIDRVESVLAVRATADRDASIEEADGPREVADSRPRTLELPSVESLRERLPAPSVSGADLIGEVVPQARLAAGGRDRVG